MGHAAAARGARSRDRRRPGAGRARSAACGVPRTTSATSGTRRSSRSRTARSRGACSRRSRWPRCSAPRISSAAASARSRSRWAVAAWLACEVFQRKVGFTIWRGLPGARARGRRVARRDARGAPAARGREARRAVRADRGRRSRQGHAVVLRAGQLAARRRRRDRLPDDAHLLFLPTKLWILILGVDRRRRLRHGDWPQPARARARRALRSRSRGTALVAAFWAFGWQPDLATHLSSKGLFETYLELREEGRPARHHGRLRRCAARLRARRQARGADHARAGRAGARPPDARVRDRAATELCQLHREIGGKPYFVLDDRDTKAVLLSNRVDGTTDKNPLRRMILHAPPAQIAQKPKGRVVFDSRVELMGWDMPKRVGRGSKFEVTLYYKVLQPVGGAWQVLMHFDGARPRWQRRSLPDREPLPDLDVAARRLHRRSRSPCRAAPRSRPGRTRCGPDSSREAIRTGATCPSQKRPRRARHRRSREDHDDHVD